MPMKPTHALLGILVLVAAATAVPYALAQEAYTDSDNPAGPLIIPAWAAGLATAGAVTGIGVWTIVRKH